MPLPDPTTLSFYADVEGALESLSQAIYVQSAEAARLKASIKATERAIDERAAELLVLVAAERDGDGRARHTNKESREAALAMRLRDDGAATGLRTALNDLQNGLVLAQLEAENAARQRQDLHGLLHYATAWLTYNTPCLAGAVPAGA